MSPNASNHTILVNRIIAMLVPNNGWPSPFYEMGHKLVTIEDTFNVGVQGKKTCNPDVLTSNREKNNLLLFECKGGKNIEESQLETYLSVAPLDVNRLVTVKNPEKLSIHFVYVGQKFAALKQSISKTLAKIRKQKTIENPTSEIDIIESTDEIIMVHSVSGYAWDKNLIKGISISPGTFPMYFFPFSSNDDMEWILSNVVRSVIHLVTKKESIDPSEVTLSPDEVTQDLFNMVFPHISSAAKRELSKLVDDCFKRLQKESKLKNKIYRLGIRGNPLSFKINEGVVKDLQKLAKEIEEGQSQSSLDRYYHL